MVRRLSKFTLLAAVMFGLAAPALAVTTVSLSPSSQTHNHGVASSWTGSWSGGPSPYNYSFQRGNGTSQTGSDSASPHNFSYTYFPCTQTTFAQTLSITDDDGDHKTSSTTHATEKGGSPC